MAEATTSAAEAKAQSPPPFHFVAPANRSETLALLSANAVHIASPTSSSTIDTSVVVPQPIKPDQSDALRNTEATQISFPRLAAFSPSDRFLALTGDDKALRVWKIQNDAETGLRGFGQGQEVMIKHLPKRAATLQWLQPRQGQVTEELVVTDKFGDIRSFELDPSSDSIEVAQQQNGEQGEQEEMDRPSDPSMRILLGHVSMITSVAFVPPSSPSDPPPFIITGDRDEHIRISRWGPKRAAHIIERFLLGTESFVGALHIAAESGMLISSDGGKALRVWKLPEAQQAGPSSAPLSSTEACVSINSVEAAIERHILVREREEKRRESLGYNPGGKKGKHINKKKRKNGTEADKGNEEESEEKPKNAYEYGVETDATKAITCFEPFQSADGQQWLLFTVDGATAFFHVPVSALLEPLPLEASEKNRDLSSLVKVTEVGSPILHLSVKRGSAASDLQVITALDGRQEFQKEGKANDKILAKYTLEGDKFVEVPFPTPAVERTSIDGFLLSALSYYTALCNWPKVEVPTAAEMLSMRSTRKGRFNHPQGAEATQSAEAGEGGRHQKMAKRIQQGRRAKGREKNRSMIGAESEQMDVEPAN